MNQPAIPVRTPESTAIDDAVVPFQVDALDLRPEPKRKILRDNAVRVFGL